MQPISVQPVPPSKTTSADSNKKRFAIASLILGIISLCMVWIPLANIAGMIGGLLGLAFGIIGLNSTGKPLAIAGIVLSVVSFALIFAGVMLFAPVIGNVFSKVNGTLVSP